MISLFFCTKHFHFFSFDIYLMLLWITEYTKRRPEFYTKLTKHFRLWSAFKCTVQSQTKCLAPFQFKKKGLLIKICKAVHLSYTLHWGGSIIGCWKPPTREPLPLEHLQLVCKLAWNHIPKSETLLWLLWQGFILKCSQGYSVAINDQILIP